MSDDLPPRVGYAARASFRRSPLFALLLALLGVVAAASHYLYFWSMWADGGKNLGWQEGIGFFAITRTALLAALWEASVLVVAIRSSQSCFGKAVTAATSLILLLALVVLGYLAYGIVSNGGPLDHFFGAAPPLTRSA